MENYSYEQISVYLTNLENYEPVIQAMDSAVEKAAHELSGAAKENRILLAKAAFATMVNKLRKHKNNELEPRDILEGRPAAVAWAIAELFKVL